MKIQKYIEISMILYDKRFVNSSQVEPYNADAWSTKRSSGFASHGTGLRNVFSQHDYNLRYEFDLFSIKIM